MDQNTPDIQLESDKPSTPKSGNSIVIIIMIVFIIGFSAVAVYVGYSLAVKINTKKSFLSIQPTPKLTACTMDAKACPDGSFVGRTGPNCEFAACPSANDNLSPTPAVKSSAKDKSFISDKNNVSFLYVSDPADRDIQITVKEIGNKIYVYPKSKDPTTGQSVEIFTKDPALTLEQAITNQFLQGIPKEDCFVKTTSSVDPNIMKATIAYPMPTNSDLPYFSFGEKCPENYKESNGLAYFYLDARVPSKFFYFSIGQYGIPAYSEDRSVSWQQTFKVIK